MCAPRQTKMYLVVLLVAPPPLPLVAAAPPPLGSPVPDKAPCPARVE